MMKKKILRVLVLIVVSMLLFITVTSTIQLSRMRRVLIQNSEDSNNRVKESSGQAMSEQIKERLYSQVFGCAYTANAQLENFAGTIRLIAESATNIYNNPDMYGRSKVIIPDRSMLGENITQFVYAEDVDPNDPAIIEELSMIGNLQGNLTSMFSQFPRLGATYIGTESGIMLLAGPVIEDRWDENGNYNNLDPRKRPWYKGTVEKGSTYFSGIQEDYDTGESAIMCGVPIFKDKKIVGVAGAGIYIDGFQTFMDKARLGTDGASCIVDKDGTIIFSSRNDGELKIQQNIKKNTSNKELDVLVDNALNGKSGVELINIDDEKSYIAYAPIENVGWTLISIMPESIVLQPTEELLSSLQSSSEREKKQLLEIIGDSRIMFFVMIALVAIFVAFAANKLSDNLVRPIRLLTKKIQELQGDHLEFSWDINTNDEVQMLAESFGSMTERMQRYIVDIQTVTAEKERIGAELNVATQIQADMLPNIFPPFPERTEFDIYAFMHPAKEVGGDLYDFYMIDNDHLVMTIADVSGKGVPAALFMVIAKTHLKNRTQQRIGSPADILHDVNNLLCDGNKSDLFVTVWLGIITISTGHVIAANAGHEYPAIMDANGKFSLMKDTHGFVLAGMEDVNYTDYEFDLEKGGGIFIYSDGIPEATNSDNEMYGTERMLEKLNAGENTDPKLILERVGNDVKSFYDGAPQFDDMTMVDLVWRG